MTRIQRERFDNPNEYDKVFGKFVLTSRILNQASSFDDNILGIFYFKIFNGWV